MVIAAYLLFALGALLGVWWLLIDPPQVRLHRALGSVSLALLLGSVTLAVAGMIKS
jgi:hypothetical protein